MIHIHTLKLLCNGIARFYDFNDYGGHRRKGFATYAATEVNLHKKLWFHLKKNVFLNTTKGSNKKTLIKIISFYHKIIALFTFSVLSPIGSIMY